MSVTIKQLTPDKNEQLMGLEQYGFSVFPGCNSSFEIPLINNKPNLNLTPELKEKFEKYFNKDFDSPEGQEWLRSYSVDINHDLTVLDPKNIEHEFILHILKSNNGMGIVAMNQNAIEESPVNTFKYIVTNEETEVEERVSKKEIKLNAYDKLNTLWKSNTNRLVLLAKYIFPANSGIGDNKQLAFDKLEEYIGKTISNAEHFLRVTEQDPEHINTVVKIRSAIHRNIIRMGPDNQYILFSSGNKLGRNEEEVIAFLSNPTNKDLLGYDTEDDLPYSVSAQLKSQTI